MYRQAALSNRMAPPRIGRNCRISISTKLVLAVPMNPYLQHETSSICVCLICRVASSCSARFFPNGCNPSLPREKDIPTKGYSPPPPWASAIRITSPFIRWIIRCRAKLFADITVTFLSGNSLTPLRSMARRRLRLYGFIRARSIFCADASLFCSGKIENPVCQWFRHSSFGFRHYLATLANDHYKKIMKLARWSVGIFLAAPTLPDPKDPSKLDDKMFKGKAMTYYGRWTYKYEIAAQKGAAAAIIIHEAEPAAYPWQVVKSSWAKENFELDNPNKNMDAVSARCWITLDVARRLLADCGQNFDGVKKSAVTKDFQPVTLNAKANIEIKQQIRSFKSHNVVGKLEGSDSKLRDEYIIYTAHWDHLGRHPELQGDQISNGAVDTASGDAAVIALASAFPKADPAPRRSVLFMATTAEEAGLLGAKFYAEHPLYPLEKTLADINIDSMNVWGKARDIEDISFGFSMLDDLLAEAAKRQGRIAIPNSRPQKGNIYRADNFEFSKAGVPSLYVGKGEHLLSRSENAP